MSRIVKLSTYINEDRIVVDTERFLKKETVIKQLLDLLCSEEEVYQNREEIYKEIIVRECEKSTGMGKGVSIPHGRCANLKNIYVALAKITGGVEWEALDGQTVQCVFLVIGPQRFKVEEYLNILAQISKLVSRQDTREKFFGANSVTEIAEIIRDLKGREKHDTNLV